MLKDHTNEETRALLEEIGKQDLTKLKSAANKIFGEHINVEDMRATIRSSSEGSIPYLSGIDAGKSGMELLYSKNIVSSGEESPQHFGSISIYQGKIIRIKGFEDLDDLRKLALGGQYSEDVKGMLSQCLQNSKLSSTEKKAYSLFSL